MKMEMIVRELQAHFKLYPQRLDPNEFVGVDSTIHLVDCTVHSDTHVSIASRYCKFADQHVTINSELRVINDGILIHTQGSNVDKGSAFFFKNTGANLFELAVLGICESVKEDKYPIGKHYASRSQAYESFVSKVHSFDKFAIFETGQVVSGQSSVYTLQNLHQDFTFDLYSGGDVIVTKHNRYTPANLLPIREKTRVLAEVKNRTIYSPVYEVDEQISPELSRAHTALFKALRDEKGTIELFSIPNNEAGTFGIIGESKEYFAIISNQFHIQEIVSETHKNRLNSIREIIKSNSDQGFSIITFHADKDSSEKSKAQRLSVVETKSNSMSLF